MYKASVSDQTRKVVEKNALNKHKTIQSKSI